jgi:hypothetical protein
MRTKAGQRESRGVKIEAIAQDRARIASWFGEVVPWDSSGSVNHDR